MADEQLPVNASTPEVKSVLKELEVPFSPHQVQWRVTNTAKDRKRGQVVPYANSRAYADRLNALFTRSREIAMSVETGTLEGTAWEKVVAPELGAMGEPGYPGATRRIQSKLRHPIGRSCSRNPVNT